MRRERPVRDCPATETLPVKCVWKGRVTTVSVQAAMRGPLAIHPSQGEGLPAWTVTHVATGYAVWKFFREIDAEEFIQKVLPLDWNFTDAFAAPQATMAAVAMLLRSMRP